MTPPIIVIAEHFQGTISAVSYELISCALEIQRLKPAPIKVIVLGDDIAGPSKAFAENTGLDVIGIQVPGLVTYNGEVYKTILGSLLPELQAAYICIAHTSEGLDFAPGLALRLNTACITGVERLFKAGERIGCTRAFFNGKIVADIRPNTESVILTVPAGVFKVPAFSAPTAGNVDIRKTVCLPEQSRSLGIKGSLREESTLAEAEVIVSAGRGVQKKTNLDLIFKLAALFSRSAVAGSRLVCDAGWLEYKRQVGLTGATVSPKLYIAGGISGAAQHLAGMRNAGFVVAINIDPDAAIFNIADICVVEDLTAFIPVFIAEYQKKGDAV